MKLKLPTKPKKKETAKRILKDSKTSPKRTVKALKEISKRKVSFL